MYILNKKKGYNNYNVELVRFDLQADNPVIEIVKTEQTLRDAKSFVKKGNYIRINSRVALKRHELVEIMGYLTDIQVIAPGAMDIFREWDINEGQG